ncbi:UNKNOWN [Stylonychia lemnae]|uniref:Transmembrane protein n=1 Tax=Stylonychia lemnae TaxID=5949 RepID=A0A078A364_STYLE|nr:UNKNOWN [Stylonychia lemnae]|eukprot:CDW76607.1 UNKNOWN [Stylonychia lemnae]
MSIQIGSNVTFNDVIMRNLENHNFPLIKASQAIVIFTNTQINDISQSAGFLFKFFKVTSTIFENTVIHNSSGSILDSKDSQIRFLGMSIFNHTHTNQQESLIQFVKCDVRIQGQDIIQISTYQSIQPIFKLIWSTAMLNNFYASNFENNLIYLSNSVVKMNTAQIQNALQTPLSDQLQGMAIHSKSSNLTIQFGTFKNLTSTIAGAIYLNGENQNNYNNYFQINNSTFTQNTAQESGGSIYAQNQDLLIRDNLFQQNKAINQNGGAIFLSCSSIFYNCDHSIWRNTFKTNQAMLDGGAIFFDLMQPEMLMNNNYINNSASYGPNYASFPFEVKILSKAKYNSSSQLFQDQLVKLSQQIPHQAMKGVIEFKNVSILSTIGYQSKLHFISKNIKAEKYKALKVTKLFKGEILKDNICVSCSWGFYSFDENDKQCYPCFNHGICKGLNQTYLRKGFWRSQNSTSKIYQCPNPDSCLGGMNSDCSDGYSGRLCQTCSINKNGTLFVKTYENYCTECDNISTIVAKMIGIGFFVALLAGYINYCLNNNAVQNSPLVVLLRILINYFQMIYLVVKFDITWPQEVLQTLEIISFQQNSKHFAYSLDCIYAYFDNLGMPRFYFRTMIIGLVPFFYWIIGIIFWMYQAVRLFICEEFNDGLFLRADYELECWTSDHSFIVYFIGLPIITFWSFLVPLYISFLVMFCGMLFDRVEVQDSFNIVDYEQDLQDYKKLLSNNYQKILNRQISNVHESVMIGKRIVPRKSSSFLFVDPIEAKDKNLPSAKDKLRTSARTLFTMNNISNTYFESSSDQGQSPKKSSFSTLKSKRKTVQVATTNLNKLDAQLKDSPTFLTRKRKSIVYANDNYVKQASKNFVNVLPGRRISKMISEQDINALEQQNQNLNQLSQMNLLSISNTDTMHFQSVNNRDLTNNNNTQQNQINHMSNMSNLYSQNELKVEDMSNKGDQSADGSRKGLMKNYEFKDYYKKANAPWKARGSILEVPKIQVSPFMDDVQIIKYDQNTIEDRVNNRKNKKMSTKTVIS